MVIISRKLRPQKVLQVLPTSLLSALNLVYQFRIRSIHFFNPKHGVLSLLSQPATVPPLEIEDSCETNCQHKIMRGNVKAWWKLRCGMVCRVKAAVWNGMPSESCGVDCDGMPSESCGVDCDGMP
ncbi:hypothetical protein AVEN_238811-1, partial [Araneus ventricosus]